MWLMKEQGGCEITWRGQVYAWPEDGSVAEVPDELAMEVVPHGGFRVVPPPEPEPESGPEPEGEDAEQPPKAARPSRPRKPATA